MTSLADLLSRIDELDRDQVIVAAAPWTRNSVAACMDESEEADVPSGLTYLLEVGLVHDVAEVWSSWRGGRTPTADELVDAVIHYAEHDAYLEPEGSR